MLSCVIHAAHDLRVEERKIPEPKAGEVLIRLGAGGICGSDLHYYHHGGVADFHLREPMILGHEIAGEIVALGPGINDLHVGDRVAVNPARYCGVCSQCRRGRPNLCADVRFFGSASRFPHVQGGFAEFFCASETQCIRLKTDIPFPSIACAEPLSVALHAANQAGQLTGKRVLITGAGPIGLLLAVVSRYAGAREIAITDMVQAPLEVALNLGTDCAVNVAKTPHALREICNQIGGFDVGFEASGAPPALIDCVESAKPGGRIVQVGMLSNAPVPLGRLIARELELVGTFRFHDEFGQAVELLERGRIRVDVLITERLPLARAQEGFELASDRQRAIKVSLLG
ncbi:MAG TPA: L-idonate 5-dehydrogenase [Chthoniobacterales bacterium]|nr:L-idonate 5-dehydrogenase [Chthoniobacterales bacterium]